MKNGSWGHPVFGCRARILGLFNLFSGKQIDCGHWLPHLWVVADGKTELPASITHCVILSQEVAPKTVNSSFGRGFNKLLEKLGTEALALVIVCYQDGELGLVGFTDLC